jgi:hypothetical protein
VHILRAYLAKVHTIIEAQFVCDINLQDIHTPTMFVMALTFPMHLSLASTHSYLKKSSHPHKPLVLWAIQMIDQLSILLIHMLSMLPSSCYHLHHTISMAPSPCVSPTARQKKNIPIQ